MSNNRKLVGLIGLALILIATIFYQLNADSVDSVVADACFPTVIGAGDSIMARGTELAQVASSVQRTHDYGQRVESTASGEIGELIESFNAMLETIGADFGVTRAIARDVVQVLSHAEIFFQTPGQGTIPVLQFMAQTDHLGLQLLVRAFERNCGSGKSGKSSRQRVLFGMSQRERRGATVGPCFYG